VVTDPQTHTNAKRQDRLQYTSPQLSAQCNNRFDGDADLVTLPLGLGLQLLQRKFALAEWFFCIVMQTALDRPVGENSGYCPEVYDRGKLFDYAL